MCVKAVTVSFFYLVTRVIRYMKQLWCPFSSLSAGHTNPFNLSRFEKPGTGGVRRILDSLLQEGFVYFSCIRRNSHKHTSGSATEVS